MGQHVRPLAFGILMTIVAAGSTPAFAKGPFGSIKIGLWNGGAYSDDNTGAFSHCSAAAPYRSDVGVIVALNAADQWALTFVSPNFRLTPKETFPIDLTFDGQSHVRVFGTAATSEIVVAPFQAVQFCVNHI